MKKFLTFALLTLFSTGCIFLHKQQQQVPNDLYISYDENSLKSTDVTYRLVGEPVIEVYVEGKKEKIRFTEKWFIVHEDWLKTFNDNQNLLLSTLASEPTSKKNSVFWKR